MDERIVDFLAIGVGPFNLSLACLTHPIEELDGVFLDQSEGFDWHPGMMLNDTTLQVPFMADLVTLSDPTSPFSFLNYLKEKGRIYSFYIRESFFLLRKEYNKYCQWAIDQLPNVHFGVGVEEVHYSEEEGCYVIAAKEVRTGATKFYKARKLVLGTGTAPIVPSCCTSIQEKAVHSSKYLYNKEILQKKKSITVVGSGQSAAEIFYDLLQDIEQGYELNWVTRSPRFFPLEYSKLTLEMTSPEYVDYFYNLPRQKREHLLKNQKHLYKGINQDLINAIFDLLYEKGLEGKPNVQLRTNAELKEASYNSNGHFDLTFRQVEQDKYFKHTTEGLVLATGYGYKEPAFLEGIADRILWDDQNRYQVHRNYAIDENAHEIFVQNAELHTHGFVTPDLGMGCYRNAHIIQSLTGKEYYPVEKQIAFQQFHVNEQEEVFLEMPVEV